MELKTPFAVVLVPLLVLALWYLHGRRPQESLGFSSFAILQSIGQSWKSKFSFLPFFLRLLALALICLALAGPRKVLEDSKVTSEGIDIVLALDCSGSMAAEDFKVGGQRRNRFEVIKKVVATFIKERSNDRLGLVGFAGRAYTVCPLTADHGWLTENLERMRLGIIEDGTAIGSGIASGVARFKDSKAKSKVMILLTDGVNNAGRMDPVTAAKAAAAIGVKVYTIGAGVKGIAPFPVRDAFGRTFYQNVQIDIDEGTLKQIADLTNAQYFRATDTESLLGIYKEIDSLEKTKIEKNGYKEYQEFFGMFVAAALMLLAVETALINTIFLKIP